MRNDGTYQLVSEHSILSARRKNRDAAAAPRTRSNHLEANGECVGKIGATRESYRRRDANTIAPDFKVDDRGRCKTEGANSSRRNREEEIEHHGNRRRRGDMRCRTRRHHAPTRGSGRRDEFLEKMEEIAEILRLSISEVFAKSSKPEERRETEEWKKENDEIDRSSVPWNVNAKSEGDEIGVDREQVAMENQREEGGTGGPSHDSRELSLSFAEEMLVEYLTPEDLPAPATDSGAIMTEVRPANDLGKSFLSRETVLCDREVEEERSRDDVCKERSPKDGDGGAVVEMVEIACDAGEQMFSLVVELRERIWEMKEAGADWVSWKLGLWTETIGQA